MEAKARARGFRAGMAPGKVALIALLIVAVGVYFAFNQANPFADPYELNAVFDNANNLKVRSPVRVAGIEVGKVTKVEHVGEGEPAARITMELNKNARPIHNRPTRSPSRVSCIAGSRRRIY